MEAGLLIGVKGGRKGDGVVRGGHSNDCASLRSLVESMRASGSKRTIGLVYGPRATDQESQQLGLRYWR